MAHNDFADILSEIPERSPSDVGLPAVRRKNELRAMLEEHLSGGAVQVVRFEGEPPYGVFCYDVVLSTAYLISNAFARASSGPEEMLAALGRDIDPKSLRVERSLPVRAILGPTHPDRSCPPGIYLLEHRVWAPAVLGPALCWAERYSPCLMLPDILRQIAALLSFELESDLSSALNPKAAAWVASGHPGFELPLVAQGAER